MSRAGLQSMAQCMTYPSICINIQAAKIFLLNSEAKTQPSRLTVCKSDFFCPCHRLIQFLGHSANALPNAVKANKVARVGSLTGAPPISSAPSAHTPQTSFTRRSFDCQQGDCRVAELHVFPVKSCGSAVSLDELVVDHSGPQHDRCLVVCQNPHWNAGKNEWQDSWGAITPRTKPNPQKNQIIDGAILLLVDAAMNPDATMTISSKNAARLMPELRVAVQPPAHAPLIHNVLSFTSPCHLSFCAPKTALSAGLALGNE